MDRSDFFANEGSQTMFFRSQNSATSKTPGNFRKRTGTSQNTRGTSQKHPGTSETHPGNFPNTPGTSQKHPELPKNTRNFPEHPGNFPKHLWNFRTPGELLKNTRGGWWVGSHNTRGKVLQEWVGLPRGIYDTCESLIGQRRI